MDDLEAHPAGLDSEEADGENGGKLPLLALIIGLIGIVVGIAGVYMAAQAGGELRAYQEAQAARPDTTGQRFSDLETRLDEQAERTRQAASQLQSLEDRLGAMGTAHVTVQRTQREMRDQTQRALEDVSREVSANRTQINANTARLEELIQRGAAPARRATPDSTSGGNGTTRMPAESSDTISSTSSPAPDAGGSGGIHVVEQGDTLSSIASRYGVSLSQLMAANPDVDPRRMRIGQQIVIPEN